MILLKSKFLRGTILFCLINISGYVYGQNDKAMLLWYNKPANNWNEALPVGNGRLGAMIFGRPAEELIQLNEETLWTGGPADLNPNPGAPKYLQPVRDALFNDSIGKAISLLKKMQGPDTEMYQPLGDIIIKQVLKDSATDYYRDLDISRAVATTSFTSGGVQYKREIFSSAPDQVIIIKLTANKPGTLNLSVDVNHALKHDKTVTAEHELVLRGKARITNDEGGNPKPFIYEDAAHCDGMRFQFRIHPVIDGGVLTGTDTSIVISNATTAILYVSAATSFNGYDKCPDKDGRDENKLATGYLQAALKHNYEQLLNAHEKDYKQYFNRVSFSLDNDTVPRIPTDQRLVRYRNGSKDHALEELYFQYGRYLLISCSRPGGIAANLQGIWCNQLRPPWRSNFTTNINLQMNYWLAQPTNLGEMELPLIEQVKHMANNGTATAKNYYNMHGWAAHHNSDIWAQTNPVGEGNGDPKWANWAMGSPWLSQHVYEHYRFTADTAYLRKVAYPIMKSAAQFCLDWVVNKDGVLVTAPSTSPENVYLHPRGFKGTVTIASAMDMEILWNLFTNIIEADSLLHMDKDFTALVKEKRSMLHPLQIGKNGNLVEWYGDWEDEDPQHRHVSHAFALHPGREISPLINERYANAIKKTLEVRGDGGTGWSKAWKINFWARLLDGDHAYKMYQELLKTSTLDNLFDTHPPFQIDGNFGATAGIAEMLLQSHLSEIQLLPALPAAWPAGHIKGLVARGNFEIELWWKNGRLTKTSITSRAGGLCRLRTEHPLIITSVNPSITTEVVNGKKYWLTHFNTEKGRTYELQVSP